MTTIIILFFLCVALFLALVTVSIWGIMWWHKGRDRKMTSLDET